MELRLTRVLVSALGVSVFYNNPTNLISLKIINFKNVLKTVRLVETIVRLLVFGLVKLKIMNTVRDVSIFM